MIDFNFYNFCYLALFRNYTFAFFDKLSRIFFNKPQKSVVLLSLLYLGSNTKYYCAFIFYGAFFGYNFRIPHNAK